MTEQDSSASQSPVDSGPSRAALSKDLGDFLIELSIGVHRYAMYPAGHPSLGASVQGIVRRLGPLLDARGHLNIGVARRQLVIEGVATDAKHPVLSELARRLHTLQLGAVSFEQGAGGSEIIELLSTLAEEPDPEVTPLGLLPPDQLPTWPHIRVHPLGYERLAIKGQEGEPGSHDRATQLWLGLAQAALAGQETNPEAQNDPAAIARSIQEHKRETAYDQVIVGYMLQLAQELKTERGAEAERVRRRMAGLVREMDEETLARLVELGGDYGSRKRFVLDANQSLAVDTVVKVLRAAATASDQNLSSSMTRLLSKMAMHADKGDGRMKIQAGSALRGNVEKLLDGWDLRDPNPEEYTRVLDSIARSAPIFQARRLLSEEVEARDEEMPGPLRLLQTALEVDAYGPTVKAAVLDLVELGYAGTTLRLAWEAGEGSRVAGEILRELTAPSRVRSYLARLDVEEEALEVLAAAMGDAAIPFFLDALAGSESRAVRRKVFDCLQRMGPAVGEAVAQRVVGEGRWYVVRNWLALLRAFPESALRMDPMPHLHHLDPRVRREALPLALMHERVRDRALAQALADPDDRNCRVALTELGLPVPEPLIPTLVKRVVLADRDESLRLAGLRGLRGSASPLVRDALLSLATDGKSLLGKVRLAEPSPLMLEALALLAQDWGADPLVQPVLDAARRTKQAEVRAVVEGEGP